MVMRVLRLCSRCKILALCVYSYWEGKVREIVKGHGAVIHAISIIPQLILPMQPHHQLGGWQVFERDNI